MSRLIVKNLPKNITEEKLRALFSQKGTITDVQLKYTKEGVFRQFAFVGFTSDDEAGAALKHFNNSYIQTSKVKVEICAALGGQEKPKSWSKHSTDSSAFKKEHGIDVLEQQEWEKQREKNKPKKKDHVAEIIGEHKDDPEFMEFLQVHTKGTLWANDDAIAQLNDDEDSISKNKIKKGEKTNSIPERIKASPKIENDQSESEQEAEEDSEDEEETFPAKLANKEISDADYMKSLKTSSETKNKEEKKGKSGIDLFTIKIHNIPFKTKRQGIIKFFKPLKPFSVRLPTKIHGFCYVGFKTEKDFKKAMDRHKSFIKGYQVFFSDFTEKNKITKNAVTDTNTLKNNSNQNPKWAKQVESLKTEEDISESGRIFFRNLAYTVNEDNLQKLFETYGQISEINLPIDPITRQIKGFGTVTFLMPEHAVKAFSELDGTLFHGRLLHLIPGKSRDTEDQDKNEKSLSFKAKKAQKLQKSAQSSHNWNTLFLSANAVAEILSKQFSASKEAILGTNDGGSSAAVRLALGESQIVMEMKKFLEENEVQLDVFDTVPTKRSKTVILVKNLPPDTTVMELSPLFSKFGIIGRIVLPPSGATALIEFLDPSEARQAFKKLAYSKFKHLPLYLEWAPENTFKNPADPKNISEALNKQEVKSEETSNKEGIKNNGVKNEPVQKSVVEKLPKQEMDNCEDNDDEDDTEDPEPDTTLFLRNLNFKTREDTVRNHFKHLGTVHIAQVAMRKDPENPTNRISLGYGFIQFKKKNVAEKALKNMQFTQIEGNQVELKRSDRTLKQDERSARKHAKAGKQTGSKILVRNIPFQAHIHEIRNIFKAFGELKSVRIPKKMTPGVECHRGFGFVDFVTKSDAKKAFEALSQSTHVYGRRLVLEWAAADDDSNIDELRKRTAENYYGSATKEKKSRKSVFDASTMEEIPNEDM